MGKKVLTICIPTYNRKERLLNQLESLYAQVDVYKIVIEIINNHSDYDVEGAIRDHFGVERIKNLRVHNNPVNLGLEPNICMPFLVTQTKWLWTLGDDDETMPNSISVVLDSINKYNTSSSIIFSISNFPSHDNYVCKELDSFIDYWYSGNRKNGDLVFLSNKVYNMDYARPYVGLAFKNCLNCVGHLVPIFQCLNDGKGEVRFCSSSIVTYKEPDANTGWAYIKVALEFSLISYLELNLSERSFKHLCASFGRSFNSISFINECLNYYPRYKGKFIFYEVYNKLLRYKSFGSRCSKIIFIICYCLHINYNRAIPFMRNVWHKFSK